ncbi:transcription factor WhiB [Streptomyces sp. SAS_275]|uniref:transcription factor WhiB n=1 Tax=Streptomyces sp. SAS_275 TaxID=3412746 RepID=UPI00403D5008
MTDQILITGILPGLHIHGLDRGETPTADYLCGRCRAHKRVTGRTEVAEFTATNPAVDHAKRCAPVTGSHPDTPAHTHAPHDERRPT